MSMKRPDLAWTPEPTRLERCERLAVQITGLPILRHEDAELVMDALSTVYLRGLVGRERQNPAAVRQRARFFGGLLLQLAEAPDGQMAAVLATAPGLVQTTTVQ